MASSFVRCASAASARDPTAGSGSSPTMPPRAVSSGRSSSRSSAQDPSHARVVEQRRLPAHPGRHAEGGQTAVELQHPLVRAGQDGEGLPRQVAAPPAADGAGDGTDLADLVGVLEDPRRRTGCAAGRRVAVGQAGGRDDRRRRSRDLRGRAVRAVEVDGLERRPAAAELVEERGVGTVPAVDRLVRVADHEHVPPVAPPGLEQPELQGVHVLELVDEQVPEPPTLRRREARVALDGGGAAPRAGRRSRPRGASPSPPRTGRSEPRPRRRGGGCGARPPGRRRGSRRGAASGPGPARSRRTARRAPPAPSSSSLVAQEGAHAVEQLRFGAALGRPPVAQLAPGHGVEGAGLDAVPHADAPEPTGELAGRLAGERHAQDVGRLDLTRGDPVGDARGEDPGLARAGRRDDGQRRGRRRRRPALVVVQAGERRRGVHHGPTVAMLRGAAEQLEIAGGDT